MLYKRRGAVLPVTLPETIVRRRCVAPAYVDVAVKRWQDFTG
jgi:hypothetical protein